MMDRFRSYPNALSRRIRFQPMSSYRLLQMLVLLGTMAFSSIPALASDPPPMSPMHDFSPFNSNIQGNGSSPCFLKVSCEGTRYSYQDRQNFLETANQCINQMFGFPEDFFDAFQTYGDYQNCTTTSNYIDAAKGTNKVMWATCCLEPDPSVEDQCQFTCHLYQGDKPQ
jgi:hypothetical protein